MQLKLERESSDCYITHLLETQICGSGICDRKKRIRESLHTTNSQRLTTVTTEEKTKRPPTHITWNPKFNLFWVSV